MSWHGSVPTGVPTAPEGVGRERSPANERSRDARSFSRTGATGPQPNDHRCDLCASGSAEATEVPHGQRGRTSASSRKRVANRVPNCANQRCAREPKSSQENPRTLTNAARVRTHNPSVPGSNPGGPFPTRVAKPETACYVSQACRAHRVCPTRDTSVIHRDDPAVTLERETLRAHEPTSLAAGASQVRTSQPRGRGLAVARPWAGHRPPPKTAQGARPRPQKARPPGSRTVKPRPVGFSAHVSPPGSYRLRDTT
jgi:hypothetical protein